MAPPEHAERGARTRTSVRSEFMSTAAKWRASRKMILLPHLGILNFWPQRHLQAWGRAIARDNSPGGELASERARSVMDSR